jgi:hypothetical protein
MHGLFRPLEEYAGPTILTVGSLRFIFFSRCMFELSSGSAYIPFLERDISIVNWILDFYHLKMFSSSIIFVFPIGSFLV